MLLGLVEPLGGFCIVHFGSVGTFSHEVLSLLLPSDPWVRKMSQAFLATSRTLSFKTYGFTDVWF